jgi:hypothetical protein
MKGKGPRWTDLLAIGYKHNSKHVLKFVATSDAGSTKAGTPYDMKFCDSYTNVCVFQVNRPAIVSQLFYDSNCIDSHTHVLQFELALEMRWFTLDPFFRLHTTLTGMTVTDIWRLSQYYKLIKNKKDEDGKKVMTIKQCTGVLAKQLIKIAMSCENEADYFGSPTTASRSSSISPLSSNESTDYSGRGKYTDAEGKFHEPSLLPMTEQKSGKKHRRQRHCQWCMVKNGKLHCTVWTCHTCAKPFCIPTGNTDGRNCFALNVRNCGPPITTSKRRQTRPYS